MATDKPIWTEGMFLSPHNFQQQDRYFERLINEKAFLLAPYIWGITELKIDQQMLALGKIGLISCAGILPDGTSFSIPHRDKAPLPISIPIGTTNTIVYLALPLRRSGMPEISFSNKNQLLQLYRYSAETILVKDTNAESAQENNLQIGKVALNFMLENDEKDEMCCVGIAKVLEVCSDHSIILDEEYIPSCLNVHTLQMFSNYIIELHGLLNHRGNTLAKRLGTPESGGAGEITDLILLQTINRYESLLKDYMTMPSIHPKHMYTSLVQLAGELATFVNYDRRLEELPSYNHENLSDTFFPVMQELRKALGMVLEETAVLMKLNEQEKNTWLVQNSDKTLFDKAVFILAVNANMSPEKVLSQFPAQIKVAPIEEIRNLINRALPGIELQTLSVAPRQIPYHANCSYFSLDYRDLLWSKLSQSEGLALHIGGAFPGLKLELWAVKDRSYE